MLSKIFCPFLKVDVFLTSGLMTVRCQLWLALMLAAAPCALVCLRLISDHIRVQKVTCRPSSPFQRLRCLWGTCFGGAAQGQEPNRSRFRESRLIGFSQTWQPFPCEHLCCWNTSFWFFSFSICGDSIYSFARSQHEVICMAAPPLVP